jgi:hypothetical protein
MPKFLKKITMSGGLVDKIMEIYAIITVAIQFGYKKGCFSGLNSRRGLHKTVF